MPDVFVNYRTGDGEEAANILATHLAARFGKDRIFRAAQSIEPGQPYDKGLLAGVRGCSVLLAIIGPTWAGHPGLKRDDDWVRREILEAREAGATVIPVLKGRKADRLRAEDLPTELEWLAMLQSMVLDTRDSDADLRRIGDRLAELVPALREAEQEAHRAGTAAPSRNDARDIDGGSVFQVGSVGRDATNSPVSNSQGIHTGSGDQHFHYHSPASERKGPSPLKQRADELRDLDRRFVPPGGFEDAKKRLREPGIRTAYLKGARGSGRLTTAKVLLKRVRPDMDTVHELIVQPIEEADWPLDPDPIDNGSLLWADLRDSGDWPWDKVRRSLSSVRATVMERSAYLVAVLPDQAEGYEEEIEAYLTEIKQPPVAEVLVRHLEDAEIPRSAGVNDLEFVKDRRPLREVREYVSHIAAAQADNPKAEFVTWCEIAYKKLSGRDEKVAELVKGQKSGQQRALMLAVAMLPKAHADTIERGEARLLELTGQPKCEQPPLERRPLEERLDDIKADRDPSGHVSFQEPGRDAAVRSYFWVHMAELRAPLREWIASEVKSRTPLPPSEQDVLVGNLAELCLADRYQQDLLNLVADWTKADASAPAERAAALALRRGLRSEQASRTFRRRIYDWVLDESISGPRARVLIAACRNEMAVRYPDAALIRLLHIARRKPGLGAKEAVIELAREDRYLLRLTLDRLPRSRRGTVRPAEPHIFLDLADPELFTAPGPGGRRLIAETRVRKQLIRAWETVFTHVDADLWESRARNWLEAACTDRAGADELLDVLAEATATQVAAAGRLYSMTRRSGFDPAVSRVLCQKLTAAQLAAAMDPRPLQEPGDES